MNTKGRGRRYVRAYAKELASIAGGDLRSAKALHKSGEGRLENVCYLAQQCVEKCLKAVLCEFDKEILFTHDIDLLLNCLPEGVLPPLAHSLGALTEYSLVRRYEQGYAILTDRELQLAVEAAEQVYQWALSIIAK